MRLFLDPNRGRASPIAPTASRGSGRSRRNGQILLPKGGRAVIDIAALDVAGSTARGAAAGRSRRLHRAAAAGRRAAQRHARFRAGRAATSGSRRISPRTISASPGRRRSACASGRVDGTIILAEGRTTLDGVVNARGLDDQRHFARPADRQRPAGQRRGRGARGAGRDARHRVPAGHAWRRSAPTGSASRGRGRARRGGR